MSRCVLVAREFCPVAVSFSVSDRKSAGGSVCTCQTVCLDLGLLTRTRGKRHVAFEAGCIGVVFPAGVQLRTAAVAAGQACRQRSACMTYNYKIT